MARLGALGVVVQDMATSLAFYRMVGLTVPEGAEDEAHVEIVLEGGIRLMWDTVELVASITDREPPSGGHRISLAFLCDDPAEVDSLHAALSGSGYRTAAEPFDAFWGQRYATVLDPDDNPVDLFAPLG